MMGVDLSMKKRVIAISVFAVLMIYVCYLQFGKDMDVVNSFSMGSSNYRDEDIKVILNKLIVTESKDEIANDIIQRVLDNSFHTIKIGRAHV